MRWPLLFCLSGGTPTNLPTHGPLYLTVADEDNSRPLAELVGQALGDTAQAERLIARGGLWLDKQRITNGQLPALAGMQIAIHTPPAGVYAEVTIDPGWIIYEDHDLVALHKPAGYYVETTPWDTEGNLRAALVRLLTARDGAPPTLHLAHRLDRDTSGVLLLSKNPVVNRALQKSFAGGAVHKTYLALCAGEPQQDDFEVATGHGRTLHGHFRVYPEELVGQLLLNGSAVKAMRTRFAVARRLGDAALVRAFPITGRTHQIRLHMAHLGHPLIGDHKYGGPVVWRDEPALYHRLHAHRLELPHPRTRQTLTLEAGLPAWAVVLMVQ